MHKLLLTAIISFVLTVFATHAQNVQVSSTLGLSTSATYGTLKEAFDSINTGYHAGSILINIIGNTTETATARLDSSGRVFSWGTSSYTNILIRPSGGAWTITGAITAGSPLIDLNGCDSVVFNGLGINTSDSLAIVNTTASATAGTCTFRFINDATRNALTNLTVMGAATMSTTTNGGIIYFATAASGGTGNDNNEISNCIIKNSNTTNTNFPYKMIYLNGTTTTSDIANSGIMIQNNRFINFRANGVYCNTGVRDLSVINNHFYHTATLASSSVVFAPVWISNSTAAIGENYTVSGNFIGGSAAFCAGAQTTIPLTGVFQVIYLNSSTTALSYINGNTIANMNISSSSTTANHSYIFMNGGKFECGSKAGNTIGSMTDTSNLIFRYSSSSQTNFTVIATGGATSGPTFDTIWIENNKIGGITHYQQSTAGASLRVFDPTGTTGTYIIRNNTVGAPGITRSIQFYGTGNNMFGLLSRNSGSKINYYTGNKHFGLANFSTGSGSSLNGVQVTSSWVVDSNTFAYLSASCPNTSTADAAITVIKARITSTNDVRITGNRISNISSLHPTAQTSVVGMDIGGTPSGTTNIVAGNSIQKLQSYSGTSNGLIIGMRNNHVSSGQPYKVYNNEIILGLDSLGVPINSAHNFIGLHRAAGNGFYYHNSVLITGNNANPASSTYALLCDSGGVCDFQNNVWSNDRAYSSPGTERNVAARFNGTFSSGSIPGITNNYNLYYAPNTASAVFINSGIEYATLSFWQSTAYLYDAGSIIGNPVFSSLTELRGGAGSAITTGNTLLGVLTDMNNRTRVNFLMGAYDFDFVHPLPVSYAYFTVLAKGKDAILRWGTSSESNNYGFDIERSDDGNEFSSIQFIRGYGNSNKLITYNAVDANVFETQTSAYYRIKQIDLNGNTSYSPAIFVRFGAPADDHLSAYPNPFTDMLHVTYPSAQASDVFAELMDITGNCIWSKQFNNIESTITLDQVQAIQQGVYYLRLTGAGDVTVIKLMKN